VLFFSVIACEAGPANHNMVATGRGRFLSQFMASFRVGRVSDVGDSPTKRLRVMINFSTDTDSSCGKADVEGRFAPSPINTQISVICVVWPLVTWIFPQNCVPHQMLYNYFISDVASCPPCTRSPTRSWSLAASNVTTFPVPSTPEPCSQLHRGKTEFCLPLHIGYVKVKCSEIFKYIHVWR
jgi:hypothetical protein